MDSNSIYKKIEQYVEDLFEDNADETLVFHNLKHTKTVVSRTKEIAGHYDLSERDVLVLYAASWFHDVGHLFSKPVGHEQKSADIMRVYMVDEHQEPQMIEDIEKCIMATKAPRNPDTLLEEIICDADTYHFGTKEFKDTNKLVLEELELKNGKIDKKKEFEGALEMLEEHQFYTSYCKELLEDTKQKNIKKVKKKLSDWNNIGDNKVDHKIDAKAEVKKSLMIKEKNNLATKGIQTMLRLTSENQMKLSDMADHKANILISVNAIIISVILSVLMRRLADAPYLTIPTVIFLLVAVITIVISILATRPKLSSGRFSTQDVLDKKTNLLFFGNFYKASYEEYETAMRKMMRDPDYLYSSVVKDIFMLAVVLGRKYRLIRIAYNIFMVGIVIAVLAFGVAELLNNGAETAGAAASSASSPL